MGCSNRFVVLVRYAVHQPSNWTDETVAPPAILFLGGTGSKYIEGQTQAFERVVVSNTINLGSMVFEHIPSSLSADQVGALIGTTTDQGRKPMS